MDLLPIRGGCKDVVEFGLGILLEFLIKIVVSTLVMSVEMMAPLVMMSINLDHSLLLNDYVS